jgi:GMP synthase (glutamine-hydrolysing)
LPSDLAFELVEPLRYLLKDEVRQIGTALGPPDAIVWRQPFPRPGLAARCIGKVTFERVARLRAADAIALEELARADLLRKATSQAFAVLLPTRSVGVMDRVSYDITTKPPATVEWE